MKKSLRALYITVIALTFIFSQNLCFAELSVSDRNGNSLYYLPSSGEAVVSSDESGILMTGEYDDSGKLIGTMEAENAKEGLMLNNSNAKINSVNAFLFENLTSLKPLCNKIELKRLNESYEYLLSGNKTAEGSINNRCDITTSDASESSDLLNDGVTNTVSAETENDLYSVNIDLKGTYFISKASVYAYCDKSGGSQMSGYEVYLSDDGVNYIKAGEKENMITSGSRFRNIQYDLSPGGVARYVRLTARKDSSAKTMKISEIQIFGYCTSIEKINYTYNWSSSEPFSAVIKDNSDSDLSAMRNGKKDDRIEAEGPYAALEVNLGGTYQISEADLYSDNSDAFETDGIEIKYSLDGKRYFSYGDFWGDGATGCAVIKGKGMPLMNARYLKIIAHSKSKLRLSELEIYGWRINKIKYDKKVPVRLSLNGYSSVNIDWSAYNRKDEAKFSIYVQKNIFNSTEDLNAVYTVQKDDSNFEDGFYTYAPLEPETTYYIAVTSYDSYGNENTLVSPKKITTPGVLGNETDDIFCINYYPCFSESPSKFLPLIDELGGIYKNRFWDRSFSEVYAQLTNIGIGINNENMTSPLKECVKSDNAKGNWTYSVGNEPDYGEYGSETDYFNNYVKPYFEAAKAVDARNIVYAPVIGGTESSAQIWVENFYKNNSNAKEYFDAFDMHPYIRWYASYFDDIEKCAPENLKPTIEPFQNIKTRYNDGEKPFIISEIGYSTYTNNNSWLYSVDEQKQGEYLIRTYLEAISCGVREVYWYSFNDRGTDDTEFENAFGVVKYDGTPKKAYYSLYNIMKLLRNTDFIGNAENVKHPEYAMYFRNRQSGSYITPMWSAGTDKKIVRFKVNDNSVKALKGCGDYLLYNSHNNTFEVELGSDPIFIISDSMPDIEYVGENEAQKIISGSLGIDYPFEPITLTVYKKTGSAEKREEDIVYLYQTKTDVNGNYTFNFRLEGNMGDYDTRITKMSD